MILGRSRKWCKYSVHCDALRRGLVAFCVRLQGFGGFAMKEYKNMAGLGFRVSEYCI